MKNIFNKMNISSSINRNSTKSGSRSAIGVYALESIKIFGNYIYNAFTTDKIGLSRKYQKFLDIINSRKDTAHLYKYIDPKEYGFETIKDLLKDIKLPITSFYRKLKNNTLNIPYLLLKAGQP